MRVAINTSIEEWDCWIPENPVKSSVKLPENPARERRLNDGEYEKLMIGCQRIVSSRPLLSFGVLLLILQ